MLVSHCKCPKCFLNLQGWFLLQQNLISATELPPNRRPLGPPELVAPLLSLSALSAPLLSTATSAGVLGPSDIELFLQDLARRFEPDNEIDDILGPVVRQLLFHESLWRSEGLGGGDASWRGVVTGLEVLVSVKSIAIMLTRMPEWIPANVTAASFERVTLLGPLCRLGVFAREWVSLLSDVMFPVF
jgi:ubiquitin conjugation factor E4 B